MKIPNRYKAKNIIFLLLFFLGIYHNTATAYTPTETLYNRIQTENNPFKLATLFNELGWNHLLRVPDSAKVYFEKALDLAQKISDNSNKARALSNLSIYYSQLGDYAKAGKYLNEARNLAFKENDSVNLAIIYANLATNYDLIHQWDKSIEYHKKAYVLNLKINKEYNALSNLVCMSMALLNEKRIEEVNFYLDKLHSIPTKYYYSPATLSYYQLRFLVYHYNNQFPKAQIYIDSAMLIARGTGNIYGQIDCYNLYTKLFLSLKNYQLALKYAKLAEETAKSTNYANELVLAYKYIAIINERNGKYAESCRYWGYYEQLNDSLYSESMLSNIQIINSQFEFDQTQSAIQKKDYEMNLQIEKVSNREKSIYFLFVILFVVLAFTYLLYKSFVKIKQNSIDLNNRNEEISQISATLALQNKDLEILNATKDKFFSIIGHDLRNPIGGIKNLTALLISNESHLKDIDKNEIIVSIDQAAFNTYTLLENLLQWAKAQSGGLDFSQEIVYLNSIVKRSIELIKHSATQKNILIQVGKIDFTILGDHNMTETVIRNLLSNAVKFTPNGGNVRISVSTPISGCQFVEIRVEDDGIGMSEKQISRVFDLANHSTTRGTNNETGTGLGLLLCKEFVERMGGRIWVESEEGKGSKFIFTLPVV